MLLVVGLMPIFMVQIMLLRFLLDQQRLVLIGINVDFYLKNLWLSTPAKELLVIFILMLIILFRMIYPLHLIYMELKYLQNKTLDLMTKCINISRHLQRILILIRVHKTLAMLLIFKYSMLIQILNRHTINIKYILAKFLGYSLFIFIIQFSTCAAFFFLASSRISIPLSSIFIFC